MDIFDSFTAKTVISLIVIYFLVAIFQWTVEERKIHALGGRAHNIQSYLPFGLSRPATTVFLEIIQSNRYRCGRSFCL